MATSAVKGRMKKATESAKKKASEVKKMAKTATAPAPQNEKKVKEARQRSRGTAGTKSTATPVTRNTTTNSRGGNKPLKGGTAAQARSTENYLKRIKAARSKDAAAAAAKAAAKAGLGKMAIKAALKAVPVVGTASLAKDVYDMATSEAPKKSSGGQMSRKKK
jgi:hypothetical protein